MKKPLVIGVVIGSLICGGIFLMSKDVINRDRILRSSVLKDISLDNILQAGPSKSKRFFDFFDESRILEENWPLKRSGDKNWWVSSGAYLFMEDGVGKTVMGSLPETNQWVTRFNASNPIDTKEGQRPQNIFRLVCKLTAKNFTQSVYTRMVLYDESTSPNRDASNGILLFNRYQDEFSLYYAGIRVDGQVVIKKKLNGLYTTLASKKVLDGTYNRDTNPNLIPLNTWIGLKSEVVTDEKGTVHIKLYTDIDKTGKWTLVLEATDDGKQFGKIISNAGYGGIRTDFMDAEFDDFVFVSQ